MDENPYRSPRAIDAPTGPRVAYFHRVAREAACGAVAGGAPFGLPLVFVAVAARDELRAMPAPDVVAAIALFCVLVIGSAVAGALLAAAWQIIRNIRAGRDIRHVFESGQEN